MYFVFFSFLREAHKIIQTNYFHHATRGFKSRSKQPPPPLELETFLKLIHIYYSRSIYYFIFVYFKSFAINKKQ